MGYLLKLAEQIFKKYQFALYEEIFDLSSGKFKKNYLKGSVTSNK